MTKSFNIIMILIDISLIVYFYIYAVNTTDIYLRLLGCAAMTIQVHFIRRELSMMKKIKERDKNRK